MRDLPGGQGKREIPLEEDLMQLARLGEIKAIQKLFDEGKYDANTADEQGITALHVCVGLYIGIGGVEGDMREELR